MTLRQNENPDDDTKQGEQASPKPSKAASEPASAHSCASGCTRSWSKKPRPSPLKSRSRSS